jgi:SAM-dependent methyltransferase
MLGRTTSKLRHFLRVLSKETRFDHDDSLPSELYESQPASATAGRVPLHSHRQMVRPGSVESRGLVSKAAATSERWREAQRAERQFWEGVPQDATTVASIIESAAGLGAWAQAELGGALPDGPWVDIGIGPLGVGCGQFVRVDRGTEVVGVDPLQLAELEPGRLPAPLRAALDDCRGQGYRHVVARGEETGLTDAAYGMAILANMLDHVQDPTAVLRECCRLLRPDGILLVSCDVFSALGRAKHGWYNRRRMRDSVLVRAHPFRFTAKDLRELVTRAGFRLVAEDGVPAGVRGRLVGRSSQMVALARPR